MNSTYSIHSFFLVPSIETPTKKNDTWMNEAQLMYRAMDNLGITDEIMGYLGILSITREYCTSYSESLYATSKQNGSLRVQRSAVISLY